MKTTITANYRQRAPEKTALYQIISSFASELYGSWQERYQSTYGCLRDEVRNSFDKFLACGILAHGCAKIQCSTCQHVELLAFSFKQRATCPSCEAKRALLFAENLVENVLLPYPSRHLVFTIPKRLRPYFRYNRDHLKPVAGRCNALPQGCALGLVSLLNYLRYACCGNGTLASCHSLI